MAFGQLSYWTWRSTSYRCRCVGWVIRIYDYVNWPVLHWDLSLSRLGFPSPLTRTLEQMMPFWILFISCGDRCGHESCNRRRRKENGSTPFLDDPLSFFHYIAIVTNLLEWRRHDDQVIPTGSHSCCWNLPKRHLQRWWENGVNVFSRRLVSALDHQLASLPNTTTTTTINYFEDNATTTTTTVTTTPVRDASSSSLLVVEPMPTCKKNTPSFVAPPQATTRLVPDPSPRKHVYCGMVVFPQSTSQ